MPEVFGWTEGRVHIWTGTATASALIAFMQNMNVNLMHGWDDRQSVEGRYAQHLTGKVATLSFQHLYGTDATLMKVIESATALHVKIDHSSLINGSGGLILYSAVVDSFTLMGSEANPYSWAITLHGHEWSRYGNG